MTSFDLGKDYTASFTPYREGYGYVAKGTVFFKGRPAAIFDVFGRTIPDTEQAAWEKAQEVHRRLKRAASKRTYARKPAR